MRLGDIESSHKFCDAQNVVNLNYLPSPYFNYIYLFIHLPSPICYHIKYSSPFIPMQVVNGLMKRPDWQAAINIPLGVIPTGSGNALCLSSLYATG